MCRQAPQEPAGRGGRGPAAPRELSTTVIRRLSLAAIIAGSVAGTTALMWAAIAWQHDQLITPRGWIVVGGTTFFALGIFLGIFGLARARDREVQADSVATLEQLHARVAILHPLIEPMLAHADAMADLTSALAALAAEGEQTNRMLARIEEDQINVTRRAALRTSSAVGRVERSVGEIARTHAVFEQVMRAVVRHGAPRPRDGEPTDRDTAWLADMAAAMETGRELERRRPPQPDDDDEEG